MKKLIAIIFFFSVFLTAAYAASYWPIIYQAGQLSLNSQPQSADPNDFVKLDNFYLDVNRTSSDRLGMITKIPGVANYGASMPRSGRPRGLFQFYYDEVNTASSFLMNVVCTPEYSDGRMLALDIANNAWHTLTSQSTTTAFSFTPYHYSFAKQVDAHRGLTTLYLYSPDSYCRKWFYNSTNSTSNETSPIYDTGAPQSLTGSVTFDGSATVTGGGTLFLTELGKGAWIRKSSSDSWYEVDHINSNVSLALRSVGSYPTAGSSTTAQEAGLSGITGAYVLEWKDRLWAYDSFLSNYGTLFCSAALSSVTPAAYETWTGSDTGHIFVPGNGVYGTALAELGDYLFAFKDTNYTVYRYNASFLPPIEEVNCWNYGCPFNRTIQKVEDTLIYFSGDDVRMTNGFQDVSIGASIKKELAYNINIGSMIYYYNLSAQDNRFPCSVYDPLTRFYHLYLPDYNGTGVARHFAYDTTKKVWIGQDKAHNVGNIIAVSSTTSTASQRLVYMPFTRSNQLSIFNIYGQDNTVGEIQSADIMFNELKRKKQIYQMDLFVHIPAPLITKQTTTLEVSFYQDGVLSKLTTVEASNLTSGGYNNYIKVPFAVNANCNFFRWRLRDVGYSSDIDTGDFLSLIGGNIYYDVLSQ
jgi:hypothetical protein